MLKVIASWSWL